VANRFSVLFSWLWIDRMRILDEIHRQIIFCADSATDHCSE
jgi:hypothetical protein